MLYFWKGYCLRTSKTMFPGVWHQNIQIQIHKYTNTVWAKIINNNIIIIIQLQKQIPELCSKQLLFFYLIFTIICFPTLSKKFFWKKLKNVNVTSHHQAIINNNIIIRSWNSEQSNAQKPNFWRRTFAHFHNSFGVGRKPIGESPKNFAPFAPA